MASIRHYLVLGSRNFITEDDKRKNPSEELLWRSCGLGRTLAVHVSSSIGKSGVQIGFEEIVAGNVGLAADCPQSRALDCGVIWDC